MNKNEWRINVEWVRMNVYNEWEANETFTHRKQLSSCHAARVQRSSSGPRPADGRATRRRRRSGRSSPERTRLRPSSQRARWGRPRRHREVRSCVCWWQPRRPARRTCACLPRNDRAARSFRRDTHVPVPTKEPTEESVTTWTSLDQKAVWATQIHT